MLQAKPLSKVFTSVLVVSYTSESFISLSTENLSSFCLPKLKMAGCDPKAWQELQGPML